MRNKLLLVLLLAAGCASNDIEKPFDCGPVTISVVLEASTSTLTVSSCTVNDAVIAVSATGGEAPYQFRIGGTGSFSTNAVFGGLAPGPYNIEVKDKNGCLGVLSPQPIVTNPNSTLAIRVTNTEGDAECISNSGIINVEATGGTTPYTYKLVSDPSKGSATTYSGLAPGTYKIMVTDFENCTNSISGTVSRENTGTSWSIDVKPIIDTNCAISGCHNGNQSPDLRSFSNVFSNRSQIRSRTQSGNMPRNGTLTASEKALIACWIDDGAENN